MQGKRGVLVPTGVPALDRRIQGLRGGELMVITGGPSTGKTAFALSMAKNIVLRRKPRAAVIFSLEMTRDAVMTRLIAMLSGVGLSRVLSGNFPASSMPAIRSAASRFARAPLYMDDSRDLSIKEATSRMQRWKSEAPSDETPPGVVIIDFAELLQDSVRPARKAPGSLLARLKDTAAGLNLPIVAISHVRRSAKKFPDAQCSPGPKRDKCWAHADILVHLTWGRTPKGPTAERVLTLLKTPRGRRGLVRITFDKERARFS